MKITRNIDLNVKETLEIGDSIKLKFEDGTYELVEQTDERLVFQKINEYKEYSLYALADKILDLKEEFKDIEEDHNDYYSRVEEFRDCGYNEEDPDFHGMCLHLNHISDELKDIEKEMFEIRHEIEARCTDSEFEEVIEYLADYGYEW